MIGPIAAGDSFTAEVVNFPAGIPGQVGARIVSLGSGVEVAPWKNNPVEIAPGDYQLGLTAPTLPGRYSILWDCASGAPTKESQIAEEDLVVEAVATTGAIVGTTRGGGAVAVPHFAMPFRFVAGAAVVVEQDSVDEIGDCVANVCRYRIGDRPEKPDFGIADPTFQQNGPDGPLLAAQVALWEPRAAIAAAADGSRLEELVANVALTVTNKGGSS